MSPALITVFAMAMSDSTIVISSSLLRKCQNNDDESLNETVPTLTPRLGRLKGECRPGAQLCIAINSVLVFPPSGLDREAHNPGDLLGFSRWTKKEAYFICDPAKDIEHFERIEIIKIFVHESPYFLLDSICSDEAAFPWPPSVMALLYTMLIMNYFHGAHFLHNPIDSVAIRASHYLSASRIDGLSKTKAG